MLHHTLEVVGKPPGGIHEKDCDEFEFAGRDHKKIH
jgi:hypothetical protein